MIETPTTLILGAGASAPYGYPVGNELKRRIINSTEIGRNIIEIYSNYTKKELSKFANELRGSRQPSIDSFLSNNEEYSDIGKLAIVDVIAQCEYEDLITNPTSLPKSQNMDQTDDWYGYLIENLYGGDIDKIHENINIISYNYDRSLEALLFDPLKHSYSKLETDEDCSKILKKIPIVHMYGRLDSLPWEEKNSRPYGEKCSQTRLFELSQNINLIYEAEQKGTVDEANKLIEKSKRIYFLGMDLYRNRKNLDLLDLSLMKNKHILATTHGLKDGEINRIESFLNQICKRSAVDYDGLKSLDAIRHNMPF